MKGGEGDMPMAPKDKIKVFISSICGADEWNESFSGSKNAPLRIKYNLVRAALEELLTATGLFTVYRFETSGSATVSGEQEFLSYLEDSDVCIFLIDNQDGITRGVQKEIDLARKHEIKSLFYFCTENSKEKTPLEKGWSGPDYFKYSYVSSFEEFISKGAKELIKDLVFIYREHCRNRLIRKDYRKESLENTSSKMFPTQIGSSEFNLFSLTNDMIKNVDCCKSYFSKLILDHPLEISNTNPLDKACAELLPLFFDGEQVDCAKIQNLKKELNLLYGDFFDSILGKRIEALETYFSGDMVKTLEKLNVALEAAKAESAPEWLIKDILIDLRNIEHTLNESKNQYCFDSDYQKELSNSPYMLYYPLLDRLNNNFHESLVKEDIEEQLKSPSSISFPASTPSFINTLASFFVCALSYGSITHLKMMYRKIFALSFYLLQRYGNWHFKILLLKTSIFSYQRKETDGILRTYGQIFSKMDEDDALQVYSFAKNHRVEHQRHYSQFEALRVVGYFLKDEDFEEIWNEVFNIVDQWLKADDSVIKVGDYLFDVLLSIRARVPQDDLINVAIQCIKLRKARFYREVFNLMTFIDYSKVSSANLDQLLTLIIELIENDQKSASEDDLGYAILALSNFDFNIKVKFEQIIRRNMPRFYEGVYKLETASQPEELRYFLKEYGEKIKNHNIEQGKDGKYYGFGSTAHEIAKRILLSSDLQYDAEVIDSLFITSLETISLKTQTIADKIEAIKLIIVILGRYPQVLEREESAYPPLTQDKIMSTSGNMMSNLSPHDLEVWVLLLYTFFDEDVYVELLDLFASLGNSVLSAQNASLAVRYYLTATQKTKSNELAEFIILNNVLKWCSSTNHSVRRNSVEILFLLLNNPLNENIVHKQLIKFMDSDSPYIRLFVLEKISEQKDFDLEIYKYIMQKAEIDKNFIIRNFIASVPIVN